MATGFVYEDPDRDDRRQKRPRLVLACDNCRRKKSRCVQPVADAPCTSCTASNTPCTFTDRERYYVERMRSLRCPSRPSGSRRSSPRDAGSPPRSSTPSAEQELVSSSQALDPALADTQPSTQRPPGCVLLFDPDLRGQDHPRPHPSVMPALIDSFFVHMGTDYSFLGYENVVQQYGAGTLSDLIANCIAALAIPFNAVPAFSGQDLYVIAETYAYNANMILMRRLETSEPSVELVNALILLAWIEYKSGRLAEFASYAQFATEMSQVLRLSEQDRLLDVAQNEQELTRLQATSTSVVQLRDMAASLQP
ncbi:hypothetical protein PUNSTDRAFT_125125 [Punctularia strigosozonata HHB-11173 SS5]|uniref:uncharacterized protein n=1 Tax=Punctularia strigosozonata (strain HHB-11173) TaxID=741275 RepID=UPI00044171F7|nr:uncharacterized protein PUNSTDRAFT_125125 [Punctularia strigosozonata HHB-11173 SS5]EIN12085.1 hypothetical protein PUNSTDRAFT_125125 [Punctularia strigosozonata HHB-11173 SS5]